MPISAIIDKEKITNAYFGKFREVQGVWVHSEDLSVFVPNEALDKAKQNLDAPTNEEASDMLMQIEKLMNNEPQVFNEREMEFLKSLLDRTFT